MRLVFMGTPEFAVKSLRELAECGEHKIAAVFTQPDKPRGRGHNLTVPPVKELAEKLGVPVLQPAVLRDGQALAGLKELAPEIIVVAAYGKILPREILELPKFGCVNVHASLLPRLRGAAPVNWSIINGDEKTGVTIMQMAEGLDSGDIISQAEILIEEADTAGTLLEKLGILGAELLCDTLREISGGAAVRTPQNHEEATYAPMLDKKLANIDFENTEPQALCNLVRGLNPAPCAFTRLDGKVVKVLEARPAQGFYGNPGEALDQKRLVVGCKAGAVELVTVSPEGKRPMSGEEFLRGRLKGAYMTFGA